MLQDLPPALERVQKEQARSKSKRTQWPVHSEEFYWELLIHHGPYRSVYAEDREPQPLITHSGINLSQTPREQCEINGIITDESMMALEGPGQSVIIHGMVKDAGMNGYTGRVLPITGRGAPSRPSMSPKVAVQLECLLTIYCLPRNIKYFSKAANPHAPLGASVSSYRGMPPPATTTQQQTSAQQPQTFQELSAIASLVLGEFLEENVPMLVRRFALVQCMPESEICCGLCGNDKDDDFMTTAQAQPPSAASAHSKLQLQCLACLTLAAQAARVSPNISSVRSFLSSRCMGAFDAYTIMTAAKKAPAAGLSSRGSSTTSAGGPSTVQAPSAFPPLQSQNDFIQLQKLVRAHVKIGNKMLLIDRSRLRKFMADPDIKCDACGDDSCGASGTGRDDRENGYVAKAAIDNVSVTSLPSGVKLWCVGCITKEALAAHVAPKAKKVLKFVNGMWMTAAEACSILQGQDPSKK